MSKKIALVIAYTGYQPIEFHDTKDELEAAGFQVITVSDHAGTATSKNETNTARVDFTIQEADANDFDGIFFIGGPGAMSHLDKEESYDLLREARNKQIPYGAICISPRILAKAGVLQGVRATGWDEDGELSDIFQEFNVEYEHDDVVVDGNVVTATGPHTAVAFAHAILKVV